MLGVSRSNNQVSPPGLRQKVTTVNAYLAPTDPISVDEDDLPPFWD